MPRKKRKSLLRRERLPLFAGAMGTFLGLPLLLIWAPMFGGPLSVPPWIALVLLGCVLLWPLLFPRAAVLCVITLIGLLTAQIIVSLGCGFFFSPLWCSSWGPRWISLLILASVYSIALLYHLREREKQLTWQRGAVLGLVPYGIVFFLLPILSRAVQQMPLSGVPLLTLLCYVLLTTVIPLLLLVWLVWRMGQEKGVPW